MNLKKIKKAWEKTKRFGTWGEGSEGGVGLAGDLGKLCVLRLIHREPSIRVDPNAQGLSQTSASPFIRPGRKWCNWMFAWNKNLNFNQSCFETYMCDYFYLRRVFNLVITYRGVQLIQIKLNSKVLCQIKKVQRYLFEVVFRWSFVFDFWNGIDY